MHRNISNNVENLYFISSGYIFPNLDKFPSFQLFIPLSCWSMYLLFLAYKQFFLSFFVSNSNMFVIILFASHLTKHFSFRRKCLETYCAVISWDRTDRRLVELQKMSPCAVPRINTYLPIVVSFSLRAVTYRSSSSSVSKVTPIMSCRRNIVELLRNSPTFEKVHGSLFKYIEKRKRRYFWVEIEPASLQGLKGEPSN